MVGSKTTLEVPLAASEIPKSRALDFDSINGKLYGRSREESQLLDAYHRLSACRADEERLQQRDNTREQQAEFVLISGPSGTGKSSLARRLVEPVTCDGGFYCCGKFDQLQRPEPFAPLVTAFTELIHQIMQRDEQFVNEIKESINECIDDREAQTLVNMVSSLMDLLSNKNQLPAQQHEAFCPEYDVKRFTKTFQMFASAISSPKHPIVLFVDDLQWADSASMDLLECLVFVEAVVVVGSCRNDAPMDSPLCVKLRQMEEDFVQITNISIGNLDQDSVTELVTELLDSAPAETEPLSHVLFQKTQGNILYVLELLRYLTREGLVHIGNLQDGFDLHQKLKLSLETSNEANDDLVELMIHGKLLRLAVEVQETLKVACCLGTVFDDQLVHNAIVSTNMLSQSSNVSSSLVKAVNAGLLDYEHGMYAFTHDKIQQACYSLVSERKRFHLSIGRNLWHNLSTTDLEKNVFLVLSQLYLGSDLVTDQKEQYGVASLSLTAGRRSLKSSGFKMASEYLQNGIRFLGENCWEEEYNLALALYNAAAEVEFVLTNFGLMNELLISVFDHARSFKDTLRAHATRVYYLGVSNEKHLAIETGLSVLRQLGEPFPARGNAVRIVWETFQTRLLLRGRSDESIMRLALMKDPNKIAAMQMYNLLFLHIYMLRKDYLPILLCKMVQLTLRHGLCAVSSVGFAGLAVLLSGVLGDFDSATRYAKLALALLEKFKAKEWLPRVYTAVHGTVFQFHRPISLSLEPLKRAYEVGLETGDTEFSMMSLNLHSYNCFHCGTPLDVLEKEIEANIEVMVNYKQDSALLMAQPYLQFIRNLMSKCDDHFILSGEAFDEDKGLRIIHEKKDIHNHVSIHYQKLFIAYLFGSTPSDYTHASNMAKECRQVNEVATGSLLPVLVGIFHGLTVLALARSGRDKRKNMYLARRYIKKFEKWGKLVPENFLCMQRLLEAEYAAIVGKHDRARIKYTEAISLSGQNGNIYIYCIANERAGHYMMKSRNDKDMATEYLNQAYASYKKWGAQGKAHQLLEESSLLPGLP